MDLARTAQMREILQSATPSDVTAKPQQVLFLIFLKVEKETYIWVQSHTSLDKYLCLVL